MEKIKSTGFHELKPNQIRHRINLALAHGLFYHGVYYDHGVAKPHKKNGIKITRKGGIIYEKKHVTQPR